MLALNQFQVLNFKNFKNLNLNGIKNLSVLIGSNGVGKSNFLTMIDFLSKIQAVNVNTYIKDNDIEYKSFVNQWNLANKIEFSLFLKNTKNQHLYNYGFTLEYDKQLKFRVSKEFFANTTTSQLLQLSSKNNNLMLSTQAETNSECNLVLQYLSKIHSYSFYSTKLFKKKISRAHVNDITDINNEGENLVALLYYIYKTDKPCYDGIIYSIQMVIQSFKDFHFELSDDEIVSLTFVMQHSSDNRSLKYLSDGSIRFIFLILLLNLPLHLRPSLLLLEEPEVALHPQAINFLGEHIASYTNDSQIMIATQSPQLLNVIAPNTVYVLCVNQANNTDIQYVDSKKIAKWLKQYKLGELWIMNLLGGNPL